MIKSFRDIHIVLFLTVRTKLRIVRMCNIAHIIPKRDNAS